MTIDWSIVNARLWVETDDDPDRQRRKQAEFLVYERFPWALIREIGVKDPRIAQRVSDILGASKEAHRPIVSIRPDWYY